MTDQNLICSKAGPYGLYCTRVCWHSGWHSCFGKGDHYYEWKTVDPGMHVIEALCDGEPLDLTRGAAPRRCPMHEDDQICPDCTT